MEMKMTANTIPEEREVNQSGSSKSKIREKYINEKGVLKKINETDATNMNKSRKICFDNEHVDPARVVLKLIREREREKENNG